MFDFCGSQTFWGGNFRSFWWEKNNPPIKTYCRSIYYPVPFAFFLFSYTAMLCVDALERHGVRPDSGPVIVTGATGGVGSVATALLSEMGFSVVAVSGKADGQTREWMGRLGAKEVIDRKELEGEHK